MRSVEEALAGILAVARMTEAEVLPLEACFGRAPASFQQIAAVDVPPFDNSSMDGYALRAADTPGRLRLVGEVAAGAGMLPDVVQGAAARIMTGAPMPPGADAVAPIEVVEEGAEDVVAPTTAPGAFVRRRG
ncbi:MAG TPA: molybdopterin molybdenumtransferase MoeA, partial [Candidatus Limnocylindria bacterium]|nr:molybdopterin molybdenumtransferase MoeA [Candidatus Limnocylindria bacterium]